MHIDALSELCAQLTRDLLTIAKFLLLITFLVCALQFIALVSVFLFRKD